MGFAGDRVARNRLEKMEGRMTIHLLDLAPESCRWPLDDGYCGKQKGDGSSYCPHHHSVAYVPAPVRFEPPPSRIETARKWSDARSSPADGPLQVWRPRLVCSEPSKEEPKTWADFVSETKERKNRMVVGSIREKQPSKVDPLIEEAAHLEKYRLERQQLEEAARRKLEELKQAAQKAADDLQSFEEWMAIQGLSISTVKLILRLVAEHYQVTPADLIGTSRMASLIFPRHVAMYLARKTTSLSLPQIAAKFGRKDHTTAWHAISKIGARMAVDDVFRATVEHLRDKINPRAMAAE